ncbi:MAG: PLP-dependent aminotransferase family protein [Lachnospiraceae bacterium]|nr:PLP-dependent aminotransferase family protein [Lachnospiraceae bacterium]
MITCVIDRKNNRPVYIQIYEQLKDAIESGELSTDVKLPSKRSFAEQNGVSVITVENAYGQLLAEGYIRSVVKKGYFVEKVEKRSFSERDRLKVEHPLEEAQPKPSNTNFPFATWARILRDELSNDQDRLLTRPPFEGVYKLRLAISNYLREYRNITAYPEQIIIGAGTEYLYMLIRILFDKDLVFGLENPGYSRIADIYSQYHIKCEHIPVLEDGIDLEYLGSHKIDVVHISPSHHFPTGVVTSIGKRYELLKWAAEEKDRFIIEDDYDSEFRLAGKPVPSLYSIDNSGKVIYMNTFSKSLASTIRISYMVLPEELLRKTRDKMQLFTCPVSTFEQYTLARFISEGHFEKYINRMRRSYKKKKEELMEKIRQHRIFDGCEISGENSGLHCVVKFDTKLSDNDLLEEVKKIGIESKKISDYYFKNPGELHTLILYY